jgi:hypothetical protein
MDFARHENFFAIGQLFAAVRLERFFGRDHKSVNGQKLMVDSPNLFVPGSAFEGWLRWPPRQWLPTPALPGSGSWVGDAPAPPSQPSFRNSETGWLPEHRPK